MNITIAIDDVNPKKGYRILGEQPEKWLRSLNEEFGCKFTLFIPSNYHNLYPLSENKEWVKELDSIEWLELAAHGHFHQCKFPTFGECEFFELRDDREIKLRLIEMWGEWHQCGITPKGWRSPGWLCSPESKRYIDSPLTVSGLGTFRFEYVAIHYEHNRGMEWDCKTFFGHDGIQMENISIHNGDMIMYQSHIAGTHNHNVWNQNNFEQLHLSLTYLHEQHQVEHKLLKECI